MIIGFVTPGLRALLRLHVIGQSGSEEVEAVVDTGFSGFLCLPPEIISRLGLLLVQSESVVLADGSQVELQTFEASVLWNAKERDVIIYEAAGDALLGMALLQGHALHVEVSDGGAVTVQELI